jgi:phosphoribosylaminoimidazole-succinocarboxamide synthase
MQSTITETNFNFEGQLSHHQGKVRDIYTFEDQVALVVSDRISAFDIILPRPIPYKGQVLNLIAERALEATKDIVPNWVLDVPHPSVTVGLRCEPFKVEMVIRGYLAGHAWREYKAGKRSICGVSLPDGLKENDKLPEPIITPTTKADQGHDEDISREGIISQKVVDEADYIKLEEYTQALFKRGTEIAAEQGLILVDTKYEFGKRNGEIFLIDEAHTPDSSRYFYADTYQAIQEKDQKQKQLSKEFVREWLMSEGFQGQDGQTVPEMTEEIVSMISNRYIELYEKVTGEKFEKTDNNDNLEEAISQSLIKLNA